MAMAGASPRSYDFLTRLRRLPGDGSAARGGKLKEFEAIVEGVRGSPLAMAKVARTLLLTRGESERARALCDEALAMAPDDGEIRAIHDEVFSADVGDWFFNMVRDEARHAAIGRALDRVLVAGGRVLDIGAGTGLFAMMAARAGAAEVISCERNSAVADAARAVIERNGLQEQIKVIHKSSGDVALGVDIPGPADVLTWDNVGSDLVSLGTLPEIEDAVRRLLKPGGAVIPARCEIKAALAQDIGLDRRRMGRAAGFDLSPFNAFARPSYQIKRAPSGLALRSNPTTLFAFDFQTRPAFGAERVSKPVTGEGGPANGVVQWLEFAIDDYETYSTGADAPSCAFAMIFHPVAASFEASNRASFSIGASHDRANLRVWLEGS
jgi:protein arginine N-methyltransferase 7